MPDVKSAALGSRNPTFPLTNYFTINIGTSSNPAIETDSLSDEVSYGKQLGRFGDALMLLQLLPHEDKLPATRRKRSAI
jgi:hypothetical protein